MTDIQLDPYVPQKRAYTVPDWCEHCDSERRQRIRIDYLRGKVCRSCDSALDAMEREEGDE